MAKKKTEEKLEEKVDEKIDKPLTKKNKPKKENEVINIKKYPVSELLEKHNIKPLNAVGFLEYYGLTEDFKREFEKEENKVKFSEGEFEDMYERFIRREI